MNITLYHNPRCSTSRNALALLRERGIEPHIIDYLKTPPTRDAWAALITRSGLPVREKSNLVLRRLAEILGSTVPIIGVGGIVCGEDAAEKLRLGATAVQLYSGLIYQGPELVRECMNSCR